MKISVVIPCRNERRHIEPLMASIMAQQLDPGDELEILIADGMSNDGTRELLNKLMRQRPGEIVLIDNPERIVSTGLNAAIRAASGEVIVRMDVHTVYAEDYIRECVRVLRETNADSVGGPWVARSQDGPVAEAIAAAFQSPFCCGGGKAHKAEYEGEIDTVYLGCWRRDAFERAGLFDPQLVRNQDDEFHFRLRRRGGRVWQSPRIRSWYTPRSSLRAVFRQYLQYGYWKVAVMRKHRGLAAWRQAMPALFVASLAILAVAIAIAWALGAGPIANAVAWLLAGEIAVYAAACIVAAAMLSRSVRMGARLLTPVVIAIYHIAYGLGFLAGLATQLRARKGQVAQSRLFTALSR
jgi:glycosyltransferase involved in cell wall biosynthesis